MKTVFFGTPDFALSSAKACFENSELLAVVTQPDRPRGRGQKLQPCEVKAWAQEKKLPSFSPSSLRNNKLEGEELAELEAFWSFIEAQKPDLFVVTAYGNIIPEDVLTFPAHGSINLHGSLLPRWRGAAPIQRALEQGDAESGVCIQKMVYELDAGDVLLESKMALSLEDDALSLSAALKTAGGKLLEDFLKAPNFDGRAQNPDQVTYARKIDKSEGFWSPSWSSIKTHNTARAFVAWPGVTAQLQPANADSAANKAKELKLLKTRPLSATELEKLNSTQTMFAQAKEPGELFLAGKRVLLSCAPEIRSSEPAKNAAIKWSPFLELCEVQLAGKAPGKAFDCLQNFFQNSADTLTSPRLEPLEGASKK